MIKKSKLWAKNQKKTFVAFAFGSAAKLLHFEKRLEITKFQISKNIISVCSDKILKKTLYCGFYNEKSLSKKKTF